MQEQRGREPWTDKLSRIANSTICFSLAYIFFTYLFWFVMGITGKIFGLHSFVYYYGIKFLLTNQGWTKLKVTAIYSSGPLFCLVLGLLFLYMYDRLKNVKTVMNVFLLWGFVVGTSVFTAQGIVSALGIGQYQSPFYQNFAVVFAWWHIPHIFVYAITIPFLIVGVYFAANYAKPFLRFAYSYSKVNRESRRKKYFIETAMVPFVLGSVITTLVSYPNNLPVHLVYLFTIGLALLISWAALTYIEVTQDEVIKYVSLQTLSVVFVFFLLASLIFVYLYGRGAYLSVN